VAHLGADNGPYNTSHATDVQLSAAVPNNDYVEVLVIDSEQIAGLKD
jgi:hypothetical protein